MGIDFHIGPNWSGLLTLESLAWFIGISGFAWVFANSVWTSYQTDPARRGRSIWLAGGAAFGALVSVVLFILLLAIGQAMSALEWFLFLPFAAVVGCVACASAQWVLRRAANKQVATTPGKPPRLWAMLAFWGGLIGGYYGCALLLAGVVVVLI